MNQKSSLVVLAILILATNGYSDAQQAPGDSLPNPYWNEVRKSDFHFLYLSDADQEQGGTWYYEREIQNLHKQKLKVYWHIVKPYVVLIDGFASPKGEESDKVMSNVGGLGGYKGVRSSLEYGRTMLVNSKETSAYIAEEEQSFHNPVWSIVKMALYFGEEKFIVNIRLVSRVEEGQYIYQIANRSKDTIYFRWDSALSPGFLEQTEETILLEGKETRRISFPSNATPMIQSGSVTFLHPKVREVKLGAALAPALVPSW